MVFAKFHSIHKRGGEAGREEEQLLVGSYERAAGMKVIRVNCVHAYQSFKIQLFCKINNR